MNLHRLITSLCLSLFLCLGAYAQSDSTLVNKLLPQQPAFNEEILPIVDSTLVGQSILGSMPSKFSGDEATVYVRQSVPVAEALARHINGNSISMAQGFRIRIFFSNSKNARIGSDEAVAKFQKKWEMPVYCSYTNPYFKVAVGNFRTKNDAMAALQKIKVDFPGAFIVKEEIYYTY